MSLERRKQNLINWISSLQEDDIVSEIEKIQRSKTDWWDGLSDEDIRAIDEGVSQLDQGKFITRTRARKKIKDRFKF